MGEMNLIDSDEAFARRLQAQEMGIHIEHTPLVGRQVRLTILHFETIWRKSNANI
jgi:hypothetical protein